MQEMVQSGGLPFWFNKDRPSRFGIIDKRQPKGSTQPAKARWFELEPMQIFHTINAWQEGPVVRLFTCYMPSVWLGPVHCPLALVWQLVYRACFSCS